MDYFLSSIILIFDGITTQPPTTGAWIALCLSVVLLACSAFVSGSEIAFFSLSPADHAELEEERTTNDQRILRLLDDSERLLATILCSNNFVNVAIIMLLTYFFHGTIDFGGNTWLEFLFMTVLLTFLLLLFGEVMPKIASAQKPLAMARLCAPVYGLLVKLWWPVSWLLIKSGRLTSHIHAAQQLSVDDLEQALELTDKKEIADEQQMLKGIIRFGGEMAREVMTPRVDIVDLDIKTPFPEVIKCVVENNYSRIPVYADTEDNIRGILYIKDLLPHLGKTANFRWQTLVRPATFVPETKMIDDLLRDFQAQKVHMAIVVDEFGGTSGLVSLEDIMEEITGEIEDEHDNNSHVAKQVGEGEYVVSARLEIEKVNEMFSLQLPESDEYMTVGGLILHEYQSFPKLNEEVRIGNYEFKILKNTATKIELVRLKVVE